MSIYGLIVDEKIKYPRIDGYFRPDAAYPEYPFNDSTISWDQNAVYDGVRRLLRVSGLDEEHYGLPSWNPLGLYVKPGNRVLVKPNLVMDVNPSGNGVECLYTHPSVIAAVIDYVVIALKGEGSIILGDAPMQTCDFEKLAKQSGLRSLIEWYRAQGVEIELKDLRGLRSQNGVSGLNQTIVDDVEGIVVDLCDASCFHGLSEDRLNRLRITNYDPRELRKHHDMDRHEYFISKHLLEADAVVSIPKAKTHRKAGITGSLKNMVGINVRKEYLPHHSFGAKDCGFDEYEKASVLRATSGALLDARNRMLGRSTECARRALNFGSKAFGAMGKRLTGDVTSEGNWSGNDTIWRTVLDLNMIVRYADRQGVMRSNAQRTLISFTDMIVIGQGEGPLLPEPGMWGMLSFSDNFVISDVAMAHLLGTDEKSIPSIGRAVSKEWAFDLVDECPCGVICKSNNASYDGKPIDDLNNDRKKMAKPTSGWFSAFKYGSAG